MLKLSRYEIEAILYWRPSADLSGANLSDANLRGADLSGANLSRADLSRANLRGADLSRANLRCADLSDANLRGADLSDADLRGADLSDADLSDANLSRADLSGAGLSRANLSRADLSRADLSGATGLLNPVDYISRNFEKCADGIIAYKSFGHYFSTPSGWELKPNSIISEVVNPLPTVECGCGVNVATKAWMNKECIRSGWKVLIRWEWLAGVVVPYSTDGKIRCARVELLEEVTF